MTDLHPLSSPPCLASLLLCLPHHQVTCTGPGDPTVTMTVGAEPIPAGLEWGQVLVSMRAAPISPADTYTAATGGALGADVMEPPYVAGHDGVGVVQKVPYVR